MNNRMPHGNEQMRIAFIINNIPMNLCLVILSSSDVFRA